MAAALREAAGDAGASANWLADADWLALVDQISFPDLNPLPDAVARQCGMTVSETFQSKGPNGDTPIMLLHEAANRIARGQTRIAAIAGGEALRTAMARARASARAAQGRDEPAANLVKAVSQRKRPGYAQRYGLAAPIDVYPLYENATRALWGQTLAQGQAESAELWAGMSDVAGGNASAWLRDRVDAETVATPTADNRPIAHPYTKLMVANSSVNQGAAFIVTSVAEARRRGVPDDRMVHVMYGAAAHEPADFLARDGYDGSAGMTVSIQRTLALNAMTAADCDHVELYSCFPCIPKMARRILDWPVDRPITVFGGLTFGGGPIGNYMSHAVAEMVRRLRGNRQRGLLFANGGLATHNHTIMLSGAIEPNIEFPQDYDFQAQADERRGAVPVLNEEYVGPATIETYTVFYNRDGTAKDGVIVARNAAGERTLAHVEGGDTDTIAMLTGRDCEPVGRSGSIVQRPDTELRVWRN